MRVLSVQSTLLALFSNILWRTTVASTTGGMQNVDQHCPQKNDMKVVVVGGGLAGLAASIEAFRAGAKVVLLEKNPKMGGNSAKATSGINGALTPAQEALGTTDSYEAFASDVIRSGGGRSTPELVDLIVRLSSEAVDWLGTFGLDFSLLSQCGGHQAPRTHRIPPGPDGRPVPVGWAIVKTVAKWVEEHADEVEIVTNARVTALVADKTTGEITGVRYVEDGQDEGVELPAAAVVLSTGGYAYDRSQGSLLSQFAPEHLHLATTSGPQATGDGVRLGQTAGASLVDMDQVQVHPTSLVDPSDPTNLSKFLAPESMRGSGGLLVDARGKRFANELATRAVLTKAVFEAGSPMTGDADGGESGFSPTVAYLLMNQEAADAFGTGVLGFYMSKSLVRRAESASEAAQMLKMGDEGKALAATLEAYTAAAEHGGPDEFGKTVFPVKRFAVDEPLYIAIITPAIHYTMGGIRIDSEARVLREDDGGKNGLSTGPIQGLYAAGEVTGGVHGANRLAGNSLLECVVVGRIAGRNAAARALSSPGTRSCSAGVDGEL